MKFPGIPAWEAELANNVDKAFILKGVMMDLALLIVKFKKRLLSVGFIGQLSYSTNEGGKRLLSEKEAGHYIIINL